MPVGSSTTTPLCPARPARPAGSALDCAPPRPPTKLSVVGSTPVVGMFDCVTVVPPFLTALGSGVDQTSPQSRRQTGRSEEHTSELQSLMRISYAVFCLTKKKAQILTSHYTRTQ